MDATYSVPGMSCGHCEAAVTREVGAVAGVDRVDVDLDSKLVTVRGEALDRDEIARPSMKPATTSPERLRSPPSTRSTSMSPA